MSRPRLLLVLLAALAAGPALAQTAAPDTSRRAPIDYLDLRDPAVLAALDYALVFGRDWLAENEVMAPFGVAVTAPGVPNVIAVDPTLDTQEQLALIVQMLRQASAEGMPSEDGAGRPVTAVALALDILTDVPGRPGKTDALCVILEAPDTEPRAYILPYVRKKGAATFLAPYLRDQPPMLLAP